MFNNSIDNNYFLYGRQTDFVGIIGVAISLAALSFVIYIEYKRGKDAKITIINSLFEEIWTNIKLSGIFITGSTDFVIKIAETLELYYGKNGATRERWVYPNPTDLFDEELQNPDKQIFFDLKKSISPYKYQANIKKTHLIPYQILSIENALATGVVWRFFGERISLNLRDLYYSIKRLEIDKENFIKKIISVPCGNEFEYYKKLGLKQSIHFDRLIYQYWKWLHFRLWFTYIDMALSTKRGIIQHTSLHFIKETLNKDNYKRLNKTLKKTQRTYYKSTFKKYQ